MSTLRSELYGIELIESSAAPRALGRSLRFVAGPKLRPSRRWTAIAAFLCGGAGAIPFALESHAASASSADVASMSVSSLLDEPSIASPVEQPSVAKLLKPGMNPNAPIEPTRTATRGEPAKGEIATQVTTKPDATKSPSSAEPVAGKRPVAEQPTAPSSDRAKPSEQTHRKNEQGSKENDAPLSFNGRPVRVARTITMKVTAYSPDERSCGASADGITASGYSVWTNGGRMVAADTSILPLGSLVSVPGYDGGSVVPVLDRGGAIKGHRLDLLFPTHEQAKRWGVRDVKVTIYEYADGRPNDFRENHAPARAASRDKKRPARVTDASQE